MTVRLYETFRVKVRRLPITKFTALVSRIALVIRVRRSRYAQSGRRLRLLWLLLWLILVLLGHVARRPGASPVVGWWGRVASLIKAPKLM